ncbi:hypothetical protein HJC23_006724 [Cyclotella cryptica]|uniref:SET domain-containing protein n=1 Tax=Cyclotella cryptica TaxID=29204 RepID=A0ABD3PPY9_9STRA|eukprot:CCRYP_012720-RA/>CCRYP_012720-RA protein AED:0.03 eAED:0.03 QI:177/1/1/1/1/1/2/67/582
MILHGTRPKIPVTMTGNSNDDPTDDLLDQAIAYAKNHLSVLAKDNQQDDSDHSTVRLPPPLSLSIPPRHLTSLSSIRQGDIMEIRESPKGRGFYAKRDLNVGERLVVAKPVCLVMGFEVDEWDEDDDEDDSEGSECSHDDNLDEGESDASDADGPSDESDTHNNHKKNNSQNATKRNNHQTDDASDSSDPLSQATGSTRNGLILLHTLESVIAKPSLWTDTLSQLFPRTIDEALSLPPWICANATLGMKIESTFQQLASSCSEFFESSTIREVQTRLPLIVRYNVLSVETSSELFVYPDVDKGGLVCLEGTGLFGPEVSFFNHSCVPNVSRYCIGDVIFFITNRPVSKGDELCFSYIEHEYLCESSERRTALLDMDFVDGGLNRSEDKTEKARQPQRKRQRTTTKHEEEEDDDDDDTPMPLIDIEMQNELMATPPIHRLEMITDLLNPQQPLHPDHDDYQSDKYNLRILNAITLEQLGRSIEALEEWKKCVEFCIVNFPPIDETTVALHVRVALCAYSCNEKKAAMDHATKVLKMHDLLFGGGVKRMRRRYEKEFLMKMRLKGGNEEEMRRVVDALWPCDKS